jgi:hypothetical protein
MSEVVEIAEKAEKAEEVKDVVSKMIETSEIAEEFDDDDDEKTCILCFYKWNADFISVSGLKYNLNQLCYECLQLEKCTKCGENKCVDVNRCPTCCVEPSCHNKHVDIIEFTCSKCVFPHSKDDYDILIPHSCAESNLVCVICNHKNFLVKE